MTNTCIAALYMLRHGMSQGSPRVHWYRFEEEQWSVRLVVESQDYVCATIAIQNYTVGDLPSHIPFTVLLFTNCVPRV